MQYIFHPQALEEKMDKKQVDSLTSYEITFTIIGSVIGVYILSAAGSVTKNAFQDGWISMLLGGIYPLYVVFIASYIIKKYPKENILTLSKKYLGVILGNILNFTFLLQFIFYVTFMVATMISLLRTYNITSLSTIRTIFFMVTIGAYAASKGIKTIVKINVIAFYCMLLLIIISLAPLKDGSILNIMPVGGSGVINILKDASKSFQSYATIEILLLIHPFAKEGVCVKNAAFKAVLLICIIYTWIIFITIYYLGIELIPQTFWPSIIVFHSIHIPLINNFVTIFMLLWTLIFFKSIANQYFVVAFILKDFFKINIQNLCLFMWPPVLYLSFLFSSNVKYSEYFSSSAVFILIFNLIYVSIIGLLIFIKQKKIFNAMK